MAAFTVFLVLIALHGFVHAHDIPPWLCPTAVFGFTDSLGDTGNLNLEANNTKPSGHYPYGVSVGQASGRYSNGYILIDFLTKNLGLRDVLPSLAYNGTSFQSLNFGYAGATVVTVPDTVIFSPHVFSLQVQDFLEHKRRMQYQFPKESQQWFEQALYYIQIGGDDINAHITSGPDYVVNNTIPAAIDGIRSSITELYKAGARNFLLFNMPAAGCVAVYLQAIPVPQYDSLGCIGFINDLVQYYNSQIRALGDELSSSYTNMNIYYFDWFAANIEVLSNMSKYNFTNATSACCGLGGGEFNCAGQNGLCGCSMDGYTLCDDPENYITFDGVHFTQHFNKIMAEFIMQQKFLTPSVIFNSGCQVTDVTSD